MTITYHDEMKLRITVIGKSWCKIREFSCIVVMGTGQLHCRCCRRNALMSGLQARLVISAEPLWRLRWFLEREITSLTGGSWRRGTQPLSTGTNEEMRGRWNGRAKHRRVVLMLTICQLQQQHRADVLWWCDCARVRYTTRTPVSVSSFPVLLDIKRWQCRTHNC